MSLLNQNKENRKVKSCKDLIDFSKVGGLDHHLKTLREVIIFPLLHGHIFAHFKIKAPRGVLFYGPPGTGKTLVAGALVAELNKEGIGKVSFFQRKGADVLDKWVGESEKNLRTLFEKAIKSRPSVIFFDELDGLAPTRSDKNDHIHSSVVATLLSLMDGLDSKPGVIVIGATNRIEAIDPALRRKGRFDKELYFPLPGVQARKEIIQVHTNNWKYKPPQKFIAELADVTPGYCGSDIQALCSEAVMYCLKRTYPNINCKGFNVKIEAASLRVEECDFLEAKLNLIPSSMKQGMKMRNFSDVVRPLLIRQHKKIVKYINTLWPHFLQEEHRFTCGEKRYAGRMLLIGDNLQGLNTHMIPSLLKTMEHLPTFVYDSGVFNKLRGNVVNLHLQFPAVILLSRIDEWWDVIDECNQHTVASILDDIHAGLPVLTIATCQTDIPSPLHNFFYNNSTILVKIENPNQKEREDFFAPLFFDEEGLSVNSVWDRLRTAEKQVIKCEDTSPPIENVKKRKRKSKIDQECERLGLVSSIDSLDFPSRTTKNKKRKRDTSNHSEKSQDLEMGDKSSKSSSHVSLYDLQKEFKKEVDDDEPICSSIAEKLFDHKQCFTNILSDLINKKGSNNYNHTNLDSYFYNTVGNFEEASDYTSSSDKSTTSKVNDEIYMEKIYNLWTQASTVTSKNMAVAQLELLYDVISTCIGIHQNSIDALLQSLENVLKQTDVSYEVQVED
ncbi:unnamed protein product [Diabrotica balteata]|uniref:AAA+ ATPase domain-containing protein n=1 Tax=Diabrotica balteata TaxID=107213 RepID=A0A9N9T924_DIABA|nr:unnamed protein product [Diabrotica balteata]